MSKTDMAQAFACARESALGPRRSNVATCPNGSRTPKYMGRLMEALKGATPEQGLIVFLREQHRMWRSVAVGAKRPKAVRQASACVSAYEAWISCASALTPTRVLPAEPTALDVLHWLSVHPAGHDALPAVQEAVRALTNHAGRENAE